MHARWRVEKASTRVVKWYPHSQSDGYHLGKASVRGPFGRWFLVEGGSNGMGDPIKSPTPVSDLFDDAKFAAAAMNALQKLLAIIRMQNEALEYYLELDDITAVTAKLALAAVEKIVGGE